MNAADNALIRYVQVQIRSGTKTVTVPQEILDLASEEGLREARALAHLSGVSITGSSS